MNRVNGFFNSTFPLTPTLSLGERVNHSAPLVGTSRAINLQPSRYLLLLLPKGEGWGEGEGSVRNPPLPGQIGTIQNDHESARFMGPKREFSFRRNLTP